MAKLSVERYPFEEIELCDEGPVADLSFDDWVSLCGGDVERARAFFSFESDVVEPLLIRWSKLPFARLEPRGRDTNVALGSCGGPRHAA
jgi:hypothetical protein